MADPTHADTESNLSLKDFVTSRVNLGFNVPPTWFPNGEPDVDAIKNDLQETFSSGTADDKRAANNFLKILRESGRTDALDIVSQVDGRSGRVEEEQAEAAPDAEETERLKILQEYEQKREALNAQRTEIFQKGRSLFARLQYTAKMVEEFDKLLTLHNGSAVDTVKPVWEQAKQVLAQALQETQGMEFFSKVTGKIDFIQSPSDLPESPTEIKTHLDKKYQSDVEQTVRLYDDYKSTINTLKGTRGVVGRLADFGSKLETRLQISSNDSRVASLLTFYKKFLHDNMGITTIEPMEGQEVDPISMRVMDNSGEGNTVKKVGKMGYELSANLKIDFDTQNNLPGSMKEDDFKNMYVIKTAEVDR